MPTKRRRWPDGAESARRDAVNAARTIADRARNQRDLLDSFIEQLSGHVPESNLTSLRRARDIAADTASDASYVLLRLIEGRYGVSDDG